MTIIDFLYNEVRSHELFKKYLYYDHMYLLSVI